MTIRFDGRGYHASYGPLTLRWHPVPGGVRAWSELAGRLWSPDRMLEGAVATELVTADWNRIKAL